MTALRIRFARAADANALTLLAHQSKAHWGYTAAELAAWYEDLTVSGEILERALALVAERDGRIAGFATCAGSGATRSLEHLFVHPAHIGAGVGRALMQRVHEELVQQSVSELVIDADPNAEPFYLALGAVRIAVVAAPITADALRVRPLLSLQLNAQHPPALRGPLPTTG